jgi:PAS domain S-box-containing protein
MTAGEAAGAMEPRTAAEPSETVESALALPDSDAFLRAIIETTPEWIKIVARDGRLVQMNAAGLSMVGADDFARVRNSYMYDLIAPEHRDAWRANHERVCNGERLSWEFDIVGLDGQRCRVETHATPIALAGGFGQLAITRDITLRRETELALHELNLSLQAKIGERTRELERALAQLGETERSFELLVDGVTDYALYMLDPNGNIVSWNAGAKRIKGYESSDIIGRHFSVFYTPEDIAAGIPTRALRTAAREGRFETEGWRVRQDGSRFWANAIIDPIRDRGELVGFAKITRDITERRATEERLRHAQKMEVVGQFTGGAAHDFNNLLMAILGSLDLLRKRLPNDRHMLALLDNAVQGARRGTLLTQRMLAFARRQELKREAVDLGRLVTGMKEFLAHSMGAAIDVEIRVPRQLPCVRTDANQLETALQNLALNARDAMAGRGTITIAAREENLEADNTLSLSAGRYICLSVTDTGHGMDAATLARATEPFFTTKGVGKGTGLGLSMVDGLAAQSGGRLAVHSEVDVGTRIELWLPVATADIAPARDPGAIDTEMLRPTANPKVVLAVDDDELVLMNVTAMLEDLGHSVIDVGSGAKALEVIDAGTAVDLVVSDQAMPGMTGVELVKAIRERRPDLPIILATGFAELPPGTDATVRRLAKPFTQRELAEAVESIESVR